MCIHTESWPKAYAIKSLTHSWRSVFLDKNIPLSLSRWEPMTVCRCWGTCQLRPVHAEDVGLIVFGHVSPKLVPNPFYGFPGTPMCHIGSFCVLRCLGLQLWPFNKIPPPLVTGQEGVAMVHPPLLLQSPLPCSSLCRWKQSVWKMVCWGWWWRDGWAGKNLVSMRTSVRSLTPT